MAEQSLTSWQWETLEHLISLPSSHQLEGENAMIDYIRARIADNLEEDKKSKVNFHDLETDDNRKVLVVEMGTPIEKADCSILIHSHVDTVFGTERPDKGDGPTLFPWRKKETSKWEDPWPDRFQMQQRGDEIFGSGSYDMKPGVMIGMDMAHFLDPPKGVHVDIAFLPDEERLSKGEERLEKWILEFKRRYHICCSPEIEPLPENPQDSAQHIVLGRRGALKVGGDMKILPGALGHSARGSLNAIRCLGELDSFLKGLEGTRHHPLLGDETVCDTAVLADSRHEASPPSYGEFAYNVFLVPGKGREPEPYSSIKAIQGEIRRQRRLIETALGVMAQKEKMNFDPEHVQMRVWRDEAYRTYLPYCTDDSHPIIEIVTDIANEVAHPGESETKTRHVGGSSNADSNLFASFFREHHRALGLDEPTVVFDVPYGGDHAHSKFERGTVSSIAMVLKIFWKFVQEGAPRIIKARKS